MQVRKGDKFWLPKHIVLGGRKTHQMYKVQVTRKLTKKKVMIVMHHYETRKCDKVTLAIRKKEIRKHGFIIHG